jgi:hypothetical protein
MSEFKRYKRKAVVELRPYIVGEDVSDVSISPFDYLKLVTTSPAIHRTTLTSG